METTIIAFNSTQDAVRAVIAIQKELPNTRLNQSRAVVVITWCSNLLLIGQLLAGTNIPFSVIYEEKN